MPKIVKIRRYDPPNLSQDFVSYDILPEGYIDTASAKKYYYTKKTNLRLWSRFSKTRPTDLTNTVPGTGYGPSDLSQNQMVYSSRMQCAVFGTGKSARITYDSPDNQISFGGGTASTQRPFTISLWFKKNRTQYADTTKDYFFAKGLPQSASPLDNAEFDAYLDTDGRIYFRLIDASSQSVQIVTAAIGGDIFTNTTDWRHVVFTYDGTPGTSANANTANAGMNIYYNGELATVAQSKIHAGSGYLGMEQKSNILFIGANHGGTDSADLAMAELAVWAEVLDSDSIKAIYNWTHEDSVVKSGYTNLPHRIRLRDMDNRPGCYPTKHRMGDKDRTGKANIFYEDLAIKFGNEIKDDFENVPQADTITKSSGFDRKKWEVSAGMTIRRELTALPGGEINIDRCATFSGLGTTGPAGGGVRFIRSRNKIRYPYRFYFELIEGPHQKDPLLLNLKKGDPDQTLKLQISTSTSFSSPITIATFTPSDDPYSLYQILGASKKPRRIVSISSADFPDPGAPYYFRLVQENFNSFKSNWAIAKIEVEYANQDIEYPLLLNYADRAGNKILKATVNNTNATGSLLTKGRSVKGVSDIANPFKVFDESLTPFNETHAIETSEDSFFNLGIDPDIYPGFSSPTRSKTKFTIDLSPSETTTFGYMNKLSNAFASVSSDTSGIGQQLMVYWNNDLRRWEKIGKQLHHGNIAQSDEAEHIEVFKNALTSSCLGFGPLVRTHFSGDDSNNLTFLDESYLAQSYKKTDLYAFPFGPQYFGSPSRSIKAKDIGITKPFLLEKTSLEFDTTFNFSKDFQSFTKLFNFRYHDTNGAGTSTTQIITSAGTITPTFFMLRQFNDNFNYSAEENTDDSTLPVDFKIPGNFAITQGSDNLTFVDKNRELITYKNLQLLLSQSDAPLASAATRPDGTHFSPEDFIINGLKGDANETYFYTEPFANPIPSLTKHFTINSNVKLRTISTDDLASIRITDDSGQTGLFTKNRTGKSNSQLKNSRSIVNGFSSILRTRAGTAPGFGASDPIKRFKLPSLEEIEKQHLYLILPNDDLIFGWQYPAGINPVNGSPGSDNTNFNTMTLFGKSKLYLYGSEVVENKEFHETVNQNLTSCAVYEHVIGDEKVVDQWQIAYRGELTGSFISRQTFNYQLEGIPSNAYLLSFGSSVVTSNLLQDDLLKPNSLENNKPLKRIGLPIISTVGDSITKIAAYLLSHGASPSDALGLARSFIGVYMAGGTLKTMSFFPEGLEYVDGNKSLGSFYDGNHTNLYDPEVSSYGVMIRRSEEGAGAFLNLRASEWLKGQGPKYSFNTKHFGHYADMLKQGHDGKLETKPRQGFTTGFDIVVNSRSPVRVRFVSGSFQDDPSIKTYVKKDVELYLDEIRFQSSNLSTASTSSIPFIEDDSNRLAAPCNRTYITEEFIVVTPFT